MPYQGHVAGGVVVFDENAALPEGTRVQVVPIAPARQRGAPPEKLLKMAGTIPLEDCEEMERAIKEGCGQVNRNAW